METTVAIVAAVNAAVAAALLGMVAVRKVRRDVRERSDGALRGDLLAALASGGPALDARFREIAASPSLLVDLAAVLRRPDAEGLRSIARRTAVRTGLDQALVARLRRRRATDRGIAALVIGLLELDDATDLLAPLLDDCDGDVKLVVAGALGSLRDGRGTEAIVLALARRKLPPERLVERLSGPWATPTIVRALTAIGPNESGLRASLARALGLYGDARAEPVLLSLLVSPVVEERVSAARALARCGTPRCHLSLIEAMADEAWPVRAQAATSLGQLGVTTAVRVLADNLRHEAWWVRANAAAALAALGESGLGALRMAANGPDRYAAERANEVLALHDPQRVVQTVRV